MNAAVDLACRGVSKRYRPRRAIRGAPDFWALRDISFEVPRGEALGVIGANGAGKSTLLRLIAGITAPTEGEIVISGRLSALIEIGSGFHPELTGRENVYLSGAILGMARREIAAKFDRIVAFAGVEPFIDVPIKWYSAGMYVRLGFAIAAHLDPDILLVDEVLAVGDACFQEQCLARIRELRRAGTTAVVISHDLTAIEQLCDRVLLIDAGRIVASGPAADAVREYRQRLGASGDAMPPAAHAGDTGIASVRFLSASHEPIARLRTGDPFVCRIDYTTAARRRDVVVETFYSSADGRVLMWQQTTAIDDSPLELAAGGGAIEFSCDGMPLQPGRYAVCVSCRDAGSQQLLAWSPGPMLDVGPGKMVRGWFYAPHRWRHLT